jgi:hypothetical protein
MSLKVKATEIPGTKGGPEDEVDAPANPGEWLGAQGAEA